jgi:hypothetical protein
MLATLLQSRLMLYMTKSFSFLPTLKTLYEKHHGWSNTSSIVVQEHMCNLNVVFGVGVYEK